MIDKHWFDEDLINNFTMKKGFNYPVGRIRVIPVLGKNSAIDLFYILATSSGARYYLHEEEALGAAMLHGCENVTTIHGDYYDIYEKH